MGAGDCQGRGESSLCALFPLEVAGSRSAGPEQPGNMEAHVGAGGHQERREQPAGRKCCVFSRWALSAKRIARLCVSRAK